MACLYPVQQLAALLYSYTTVTYAMAIHKAKIAYLVLLLACTAACDLDRLLSEILDDIPVILIFDPDNELGEIPFDSNQYLVYINSIKSLEDEISQRGCENTVVYLHRFIPGLFGPQQYNNTSHECVFLVAEKTLNSERLPDLRFDTQLYSYSGTECWEHYGTKGLNLRTNINCEDISPNIETWRRRSNLFGTHLDFLTMESAGVSGVFFDLETSAFLGPFVDIITELSSRLNFTYSLREPPDGKWGGKLDNGTWNGIVGELHRRLADMSVSAMSMSAERAEVISFSPALHMVPLSVTMHDPSLPSMLQYKAYLFVFDLNLWICLLIQAVVFAVYLVYFQNVQPTTGFRAVYEYSLAKGDLLPTNGKISAQIALLSFSLSMYLLFTYYCAYLTSLMTAAPTSFPIKSAQDLFDRGYRMVVLRDTYPHSIIATTPEGGLYNFFHHRMTEEDFMVTPEALNEALLSDKKTVVYGEDEFFAKSLSHLNVILLQDFEEKFSDFRCFSFPQHSEYFGLFSYHMRKLQEEGVVHRIYTKWNLIEPLDSEHGHTESPPSLGWSHLFSVWTVLAAGILSGAGFLCMETLAHKTMKEKLCSESK